MNSRYFLSGLLSLCTALPLGCVNPKEATYAPPRQLPVIIGMEKIPQKLENAPIRIEDRKETVYCEQNGEPRGIMIERDNGRHVFYIVSSFSQKVNLVALAGQNEDITYYDRSIGHYSVFFKNIDAEVMGYLGELRERGIECNIFGERKTTNR